MTHKVEQFVEKIMAPLVCRSGETEWKFNSGIELAKYSFDKHYLIDSLEIENGSVVLIFSEWTHVQTNWVGENRICLMGCKDRSYPSIYY